MIPALNGDRRTVEQSNKDIDKIHIQAQSAGYGFLEAISPMSSA